MGGVRDPPPSFSLILDVCPPLRARCASPMSREQSAAMASLADYVQAALMLNYNQRKVG